MEVFEQRGASSPLDVRHLQALVLVFRDDEARVTFEAFDVSVVAEEVRFASGDDGGSVEGRLRANVVVFHRIGT